MAVEIKARLRVKAIYLADPITQSADVSTAVWGDKMPVTLRDDEVLIVEADPEEDPVYSHENDAPEEIDYIGQGLTATGSFIRASRDQLADLMGGEVKSGKYEHSASKLVLNKAIKMVCADDSEVIIPNASGFVNMNLSLGKSGTSKFPFSFKCLRASDSWDVDLIM